MFLQINDAIRIYQEKETWNFGHCWEILRYEPKWNNKVLETSSGAKANNKKTTTTSETPTQSAQVDSEVPQRPEGRDSAKRQRGKSCTDTSSSSVAVQMLEKMHERGHEIEEKDVQNKEELMNLHRAKFELQKEQWKANYKLTQEQVQIQRESLESNRLQSETQIMFTNLDNLFPPIRAWVLKKQAEILARAGVPGGSDGGPNGSNGGPSGSVA
jgi:hypothetical protein